MSCFVRTWFYEPKLHVFYLLLCIKHIYKAYVFLFNKDSLLSNNLFNYNFDTFECWVILLIIYLLLLPGSGVNSI